MERAGVRTILLERKSAEQETVPPSTQNNRLLRILPQQPQDIRSDINSFFTIPELELLDLNSSIDLLP